MVRGMHEALLYCKGVGCFYKTTILADERLVPDALVVLARTKITANLERPWIRQHKYETKHTPIVRKTNIVPRFNFPWTRTVRGKRVRCGWPRHRSNSDTECIIPQ